MDMINRLKLILFAMVCVFSGLSYANPHTTVTVYSFSQLSLENVPKDVKVCNLSMKRSLQLPFKGGATKADIQSWMTLHQSELKTWQQQTVCRYQADFLNLKYLPAVVMNNTYVVYGNSDIEKAIHAINVYRVNHTPTRQGVNE